MAAFGLVLDAPLVPNIDAFINPSKDEDAHRSALNAVVLNIHRAGVGAFEELVSKNLGEYITNVDDKVRQRATLLLAELLARLPKLPLAPGSAARFATFFASRLGDYPSIVPSLKALSSLIKNHSPALLHVPTPVAAVGESASRGAADAEEGGGAGAGSSGVIARGVFEELHLPALAQSIRQAALSVLCALVSNNGLRGALSTGMGIAFVTGLVSSLEGEKDPRCLIVGLSALRQMQQGFDPRVLEETCEAVFDATACYFPVTFTPPPNDPHNISPDALKTGLEEVLVGSPGMARHVVPMLLDKLSSEVSVSKEASLKALVSGVRAFGPPGVGVHLRAIGQAMFEEAVNGADPDLASLALLSLTEVVRESASHAELTGTGEACSEWTALARPLLVGAVAEVGGDQPCSVLGRGAARVLQALARSSALGLRSALALAVPRLLKVRQEAAVAAVAATMAMATADNDEAMLAGPDEMKTEMGSSIGDVEASALWATAAAAGGVDDAQAARLEVLAGLVAGIDDKVDFSGSPGGAPIDSYISPLLAELSAALGVLESENAFGSDVHDQSNSPSMPVMPYATPIICIAAKGLSDLVTRPPTPVLGADAVRDVVTSLASALFRPEAWGLSEGGSAREEGEEREAGAGAVGVDDGTAAYSILAAVRAIGVRRPEYAQIVVDTVVTPLLAQLAEASANDDTGNDDHRDTSDAAMDARPAVGSGGSGGGGSGGICANGCAAKQNNGGYRFGAVKHAFSALVELSELPSVFAVAAPAMLAGATSSTRGDSGNGSDTERRPFLLSTRTSELSLHALDGILKQGVKWRHNAELLLFIQGESSSPGNPTAGGSAGGDGVLTGSSWSQSSSAAAPAAPATTAVVEEGAANEFCADTNERVLPPLRGLPLLLVALEGSSSIADPKTDDAKSGGVSEVVVVKPNADGDGGDGGIDMAAAAASGGSRELAGSGLTHTALRAAVSAVRTCTRVAPADEQEALLSSLLSKLVVAPSFVSTTGGGGGVAGAGAGDDDNEVEAVDNSGGDGRGGSGIAEKLTLLPVLAAVMGTVSFDSRALASGGTAATAVPALLAAGLAEGGIGLEDGRRSSGTRVGVISSGDGCVRGSYDGHGTGRGVKTVAAAAAPCCQCLAAVLNKLARGPELDSAVRLVVTSLKEAFEDLATPGGEIEVAVAVEEGMEVDFVGERRGEEARGEEGDIGPLQCLAWTMKAVAMRGGLGDSFVELLDMLCGLLMTAGGTTAPDGRQQPSPRALAAAAGFRVALEHGGEALRADGEDKGARVSPLWRQRFFVQAFPKLVAAARLQQPASAVSTQSTAATIASSNSGINASNQKCDRVPALLALLHIVRGVPTEVLSQEMDSVVPAVVQAMGSNYPPLQAAALETFQELSAEFLTAFSQHLSSVIPLLLTLAEGGKGAVGGGGKGGHRRRGVVEAGAGAMTRFRAVQCLTAMSALPYSRLHPFRNQVTRRLRVPLDDDRRAVRQAAAQSRNVWFLLG